MKAMDQSPIELTMRVEGMTCEGCAEAVRRTIRRLDPRAEVSVDVGHGRVTATTVEQSLDVAQALTKAGYTATAMTG
jgi:copper chaperone